MRASCFIEVQQSQPRRVRGVAITRRRWGNSKRQHTASGVRAIPPDQGTHSTCNVPLYDESAPGTGAECFYARQPAELVREGLQRAVRYLHSRAWTCRGIPLRGIAKNKPCHGEQESVSRERDPQCGRRVAPSEAAAGHVQAAHQSLAQRAYKDDGEKENR